MATVITRNFVYASGLDSTVEALGVEVRADDGPARVSAVGWEVQSNTGGAQIFVGLRASHPHPRLPHDIVHGSSSAWMITRDEILAQISSSSFDINIEFASAALRAFATVNGTRVQAAQVVALMDEQN